MGCQQDDINIFKFRTIEEYLMSKDEERELLDTILSNVMPKQRITCKFKNKYFDIPAKFNDLYELPYKWILHINNLLAKGNQTMDSIQSMLYPIFKIKSKEHFLNCSVFDVFASYSWMLETMTEINQWKIENLSSSPTAKQVNAGIESFNELGDFVTIDALAVDYKITHEEVLEMPYGRVLRKLRLNKLMADYSEKYQKP